MRAWAVAAAVACVASSALAAVDDDLRDGDRYFEQGDWKKAAVAYDRAIAKAAGDVPAEAYGKRAAIFIIQHDLRGGLAFVARAKQRSSTLANAPELLEQEALLLWQADKRDDAIAIAGRVVAARPQTFTNQELIGEYYATRDPAKSAAAFEQYLAHRPPELAADDALPRIRLAFAYLANGHAALAAGDDARARELYTKAVAQLDVVTSKLAKKPDVQVNADNGLCAAYAGLEDWDRAETVCERALRNPKHVDTNASAWFNAARAYLARKQTRKARSAAEEFLHVRKSDPRGLVLVGDTYYEDRAWQAALDQYLRADKLMHGTQSRDQIELSIRLGKTYRRLPAPANGDNPNLALAIDKLASAQAANPGNLELAIELGDAYLEAKQDAKASALGDRVLALDSFAHAPVDERVGLLAIAGRAWFAQHQLDKARARLEAARQLEPDDVQVRHALVATLDEQAYTTLADPRAAQALLEQALAVDASSPTTLTDLAVLAIERGECDAAHKQLARLRDVRGADAVLVARLDARALACTAKPDPGAVAEAYARAEKQAKAANAQLVLAEVYTEWAPLLVDSDLDDAVRKLEVAVEVGGSEPELGPAARRNLALALYRRGWRSLRDNKANEAAADFERAARDPSVLRTSEPLAFDLSFALALLDGGRAPEAAKVFKSLASRGGQASYLKAPFAKVGAQFLTAYAAYRGGTGAARQQACGDLARLQGELAGRAIGELVASCWETVAVDEARAGNIGAAQKAFASADKTANAEQKKRLALDRAALALGKDKLAELDALAGTLPEALVDLGIVYELVGRPKDAFETWQRARAKGATTRDLQKWIDAKRRIYGF
jgi:hypothetical protein